MPTDSFDKVRVTGVVVAGSGVDCVEIEDAAGLRWSLLGVTDPLPRLDQRVSATGVSQPMSPDCAGIPLNVSALRILPNT